MNTPELIRKDLDLDDNVTRLFILAERARLFIDEISTEYIEPMALAADRNDQDMILNCGLVDTKFASIKIGAVLEAMAELMPLIETIKKYGTEAQKSE